MSTWKHVRAGLDRIERACVVADWDGIGAAEVSAETLATARRLVARREALGSAVPTSAVATPSGTILFSWQFGQRHTEAECRGRLVEYWTDDSWPTVTSVEPCDDD